MKKLLFASLVLLISVNLFSQSSFNTGNIRAGAGLFFASEINNVGLTINGVYEITELWEGALAFTHMFEKEYVSWNILDLDGHYVFHQLNDQVNFYGLAGLSFTFWKVTIPEMDLGFGITTPEVTETGTDVGFNIGGGANIAVSETINIAPEMRVTLMEGTYFRIGATVQYMF